MVASSIILAALALAGSLQTVSAHSAMFCVKYNKATKTCEGRPRLFDSTREIGDGYMGKSNDPNNPCGQANSVGFGGGRYATYNDANPLGKARAGDTITIMWPARNHAVSNQNPANNIISMARTPFAGPLPDRNVPKSEMTVIGTVPFMSNGEGCEGGNGNENVCTGDVKIPTGLAPGVYQIHWDWKGEYQTCGDIQITADGGATQPPPAAQPSLSSSPSSSPAANTGGNNGNTPTPAAPSPTPSSSALPPVPVGGSVKAQVGFTIAWRGGNGWGAQVSVASSGACKTWSLSFDLASGLTVTNAWNAQVSGANPTYTFTAPSYMALNAGDRRSFGFNGGRPSADAEVSLPTNFKFICDGAQAAVGSTAALQLFADENPNTPTAPFGEFAKLNNGNNGSNSGASSTLSSAPVMVFAGLVALVAA